jgi:Fur family ferric uptake transcriptional regulator
VNHPATREVEWTRLLHERGLRRTEPRVAVLRRLGAARAPLAHRDLVRMLAHLGFDRATLYRNLMDLVDAGLVTRRDIGHLWRFELVPAEREDRGRRRVHFVCTKCGALSQLPEEAVRVSRVRGAPRSLACRDVEVEVRGRCDGCR